MSLCLPKESELDKNQKAVLDLPVTDNYLVVGGPGTGKTVLAVYRAKKAIEESSYKPVLLLVYNNPLKEYISASLKKLKISNIDVSTYHQWIFDVFREYQFGSVPKEGSDFNWDRVVPAISRIGEKYFHIVVDEAQDFPVPLINLLKRVSENRTFFIDPNQAVEEGKTNVSDFMKKLFTSDKIIELSKNFRNTKEIRDLASLFCLNGKPPISSRSGRKPVAIKCTSGDFDGLNVLMAGIIKRHSGKNIGIITNSRMLTRVYDYLKDTLSEEIPVQLHKSQTSHRINFSKPGVKVVSFGTMKGLEFDVVLIPLFDKIDSHHDDIIDNNRVYVAVTRTLGDLYLLYWNETTSPKKIDTMSKLFANRKLIEWR